MHKGQNGFSVIEIIIVFLLIAIVAATGLDVFLWHNHKTNTVQTASISSSSSNQTPGSTDPKTEQDLAKLGYALENYSNGASCLPTNLKQLDVKNLNFSLDSYQYKLLNDCTGGPGEFGYQICAYFKTNTFSASAYNSVFNVNDPDGGSPQIYSVHDEGEQCFENYLGDDSSGLQMVLNAGESKVVGGQPS